MNKYNAAQSVYLSLYSADFYRDVAQNWQGTGIKYLTGLLMLTCIPVSAKIYMEAGETARVLGSITAFRIHRERQTFDRQNGTLQNQRPEERSQ